MRTESNKNTILSNVMPIEPIAPYFGGKRLLAKTIVPIIDNTPHDVYAEPFMGMGGIFFRRTKKPRCEAINDINQDLIILYRVLERFYPYFADMMKYKLCSRAEFERLKAENPNLLLDFERAARFLYLQKIAFGGKVTGQNFGISIERNGRFDVSKVLASAEELHERLRGVYIECLPYADFIQRYNRGNTLFYLDPPYWDCETDYGKGIFNKEDFTHLSVILRKIKGKFIMSINDVPPIREIFKGLYLKEVTTKYSLTVKSKEARELLVSNFKI